MIRSRHAAYTKPYDNKGVCHPSASLGSLGHRIPQIPAENVEGTGRKQGLCRRCTPVFDAAPVLAACTEARFLLHLDDRLL